MMTPNRYEGSCVDCGREVRPYKGVIEKVGGKWITRCQPCYDASDNSGVEDRECGDRAYEDRYSTMFGGEL